MVKRPIQVYLDSSDISRFADVIRGRGDRDDETLFNQLQALAQKGDAQFPFSSLHVSEAAPWDDASIEPATARFEILETLSLRAAFRAFSELPALDAFAYSLEGSNVSAKPVDRYKFHGRSDHGEWLPGLPKLFEEISTSIRLLHLDPMALAAEQDLLPKMNRRQRREAQYRAKTMTRTDVIRTQIESNWDGMYERICSMWPLSRSDSDVWKRFFKSTKPDPIPVYISFRNGFAEPKRLIRFLAPGGGTLNNELTSWMRNSSEKLLEAVDHATKLRTLLSRTSFGGVKRDMRREAVEFGRDFQARWLLRERKDIETELVDTYNSYLLSGQITSACPTCPPVEVIAKFPSVSNRVSVFRSYIEKVILPIETNRSREKYRSDVGDMMHAQYIPYCDIFRCDGFAATYLSTSAKKFDTSLVASRKQLLLEINHRLARD